MKYFAESNFEAFTRGYIACAQWLGTYGNDDKPCTGITTACVRSLQEELEPFYENTIEPLLRDDCSIDAEHAGHDYFLSRNGHGTGFFDDEKRYGVEGAARLQAAAKATGEIWLLADDDGVIVDFSK